MAKLAVIYSKYPAGGRLEVYGEEIVGVRSSGDLADVVRQGEVFDCSLHASPREAWLEAERRWPGAEWTTAMEDLHARTLAWSLVG